MEGDMISYRKLKTYLAATIAVSALANSSPTQAQDLHRGKPITMVVGLAPGVDPMSIFRAESIPY